MRTTPGTHRRNARGEGARLADDIVAGAQAIIERTGSDEGVTLRSVAREVGIAAPSIYAHFADREAILWGVVRKVFEELRVQVEAATVGWGDPVDRLVSGCEAYVTFGLGHPSLYRALYARQFPPGASGAAVPDRPAAAGAVPDLSVGPTILLDDRFPPVGGEAFALLVEAIERCVTAGRSTSTDPFEDATAVWVALHGMVSLWSTVCDFPWPEGQHQFVRRLVLPLARVGPSR